MGKTQPKTLLAAVNAVMREVGYVEKAGEVTGFARYKYAGEAQFIAAIRPWMVEFGLCLRCVDSVLLHTEILETQKGPKVHQTWSFSYVLTHAPSGELTTICAVSNSVGTDDKGAFKAMTGAYKYAMRQTFMIETGDDPDKYQGADDFSAAPAVAKKEQKRAKANERGTRAQLIGSIIKSGNALGNLDGSSKTLVRDNVAGVIEMCSVTLGRHIEGLTDVTTQELEQVADDWRAKREEK